MPPQWIVSPRTSCKGHPETRGCDNEDLRRHGTDDVDVSELTPPEAHTHSPRDTPF